MSGTYAKVAMAPETSYGEFAAPDRPVEFVSESIKLRAGRIESKSLGRGPFQRADRFVINRQGAGGDLLLEVGSTGLVQWLPYILGTVTSTTFSGAHKFTAVPGPLFGKSFSLQVQRPEVESLTLIPFSYAGCKVLDAEFSCQVGQVVEVKLTIDAQNEDMTQDLVTLAWSSVAEELLSFIGGTVTIGSDVVAVKKVTVKFVTGQAAGRQFISGSGLAKEPVENGMRDVQWGFDLEYIDDAQAARVRSASAAGAVAGVVLEFDGQLAIGTTVPSVKISSPAVRFDSDTPTVGGPQAISYSLTGRSLAPATGGAPAVTVEVVTVETTV